MKKLLLTLFIMFYSTSCAMSEVEIRMNKRYDGIHEEFKPYIQEFIYVSQGKIDEWDFRGFSMGFRDYKGGSVVGTCHPTVYEVDISKSWWDNTTSHLERYELVFHELGHCVLNRGHTQKPTKDGFLAWLERLGFTLGIFQEKGRLPDGCPASFMHPYTLGEKCISKHFNYYLEELFNRQKDNYVEIRNISRDPAAKRQCKTPRVINKTKTWNKRDQGTLDRAKKKCIREYNSCLKIFWKKTELSYSALCE